MKASALRQNLLAGKLTADQGAAVADDRGFGEAGNAAVGDRNGVGEPLGQKAESRSEHQSDARTPGAKPEPDLCRRRFDVAHMSLSRKFTTEGLENTDDPDGS